MSEIKHGFAPVYDENSKVLILGSFPSVKSRQTEFYYGHPQNRFWRVLASYFGAPAPKTVEDKRKFVLLNRVALWDIVTECEIVGSQDATIKNFKVADIKSLLQNSAISYIILNGGKAFSVFEKHFADIGIPYERLPSTSPANTRCSEKEWDDALRRAFDKA